MKKIMKGLAIFGLAVLLVACSSFSQDGSSDTDNQRTVKNEEKPLTEKEKLITQLPEDAHASDWNLILVNNDHPVPENYDEQVTMVPAENGLLMDERIFENWDAWNTVAQEAGYGLVLVSAYRSVDLQQSLFDDSYQQNLARGYSEEEAREKTMEYLTIPGSSEHHTGLALDIVDTDWAAQTDDPLVPEYDQHPSQHFLVDTMTDYGFILRYPKGKEDITGIQYESWHFRYVGKENARFITEHDLTLEEYLDLLNQRDQQAQ